MKAASLLLVALLAAGCLSSDGPRDDPGAPGGDEAFDPADPRLPRFADGTLDTASLGTPDVPGFPLFGPAVAMNQSFAAGRETSLAVGPKDAGLVLGCSPSGVPNTSGGQSYFYRSSDDGATFTDLDVETAQTDPRQVAFEGGDCDVWIGPEGTAWSADTWLGSLSVGRSRDGGATWEGTSVAASSPVVDRPWLATDASGTLHFTYQDVQALMPSAIWYTRVLAGEGALVFAPAVPVAGVAPTGGFTWTGNLVVSDDGQQLWSVYTRRMLPVTSDLEGSGPETLWVARSTDGGLTWTSILVDERPAPISFLYASLARDGLGVLHAVFAQRTDTAHPVFHTWSKDDGTTWSEPVAVRADVAAYSPWVAGAPQGGAAIQWFGSLDPKADPSDNETGWSTFWATATPDGDGYVHRSGTTTPQPFFVGAQGETPEFNMVRLDPSGAMRMGFSARVYDAENDVAPWLAFHQAQVAGPLFAPASA